MKLPWQIKLYLLMLVVFAVLSVSEASAAGVQFCEPVSSFAVRCVQQVGDDSLLPFTLTGYGEVTFTGMSAASRAAYAQTLDPREKKDLFSAKGIQTSLYSRTQTETAEENELNEAGQVIGRRNVTRPARIWVQPDVPAVITFSPERGREYHFGFDSDVFNVTDYANGTCSGCSIDTNLELVNAHSTVNRSGLVGEWLFTDNANDTSGNRNNGTVAGGALHPHERYVFDGVDDYIALSDGLINTSRDFTVSLWVLPSNTGISNPRLIGIYLTAFNSLQLGYSYSGSPNTIYFRFNGASQKTTQTMLTGAWNHIILSKNSTHNMTYINGVLATYTGTAVTADGSMSAIGAAISTSSYLTNGSVDEVRLWNRTLSPAEVLEDYNSTLWAVNGSTATATYAANSQDFGARKTFTNLTVIATNRTTNVVQVQVSEDNSTWGAWLPCSFGNAQKCKITPPTVGRYLKYQLAFSTDNKSYTPVVYNTSVQYESCVETWQTTELWNSTSGSWYQNVSDVSSCGTLLIKPSTNVVDRSTTQFFWIIVFAGITLFVLGVVFEAFAFSVAGGVFLLLAGGLLLRGGGVEIAGFARNGFAVTLVLVGLFFMFEVLRRGGD